MATVQCEKVRITISKGKELELLDALHQFGKVELIKKRSAELTHPDLEEDKRHYERDIAVLDKAIQALSPFMPKQSFLDKLSDTRIPVTEADLKVYLKEKEDILKEAASIENMLERIEELDREEHRLEEVIHNLDPFKDVELAIFGKFTGFFLKAFTVSKESKESLIKDLNNNFDDIEFFPVSETEKEVAMVIAGPKSFEGPISEFILHWGKILQLDENITGDFKAVVQKNKDRLEKCREERAQLRQHIEHHVNNIDRFLVLKNILSWEVEKIETLDSFTLLRDTYSVDFWIDPAHLEELKQLVLLIDEKATVNLYTNVEIKEKRVSLKNMSFFKAFETITTTMGYPEADQVDPTPILTPFFILFFGLALSDAGYGLVLTLIAAFLLITRKLKPGLRSMMIIILWSGISTVIFGALMGSWFGFVPDYYQATLETTPILSVLNPLIETLKFMMIIDPVANVPLLLMIMIGLGIIHLTVGYLAAFYGKARHGQFIAGFLDDFIAALLIASLVFVGLTKGLASMAHLGDIAMYSVLIILGLMVLAKGRSAKWYLIIPVGLIQTFMAAVGLLSETLSYARLLALGIATGVIAGVINMLAFLTGGAPFVGPLLIALVMLGGHLFNIMLNLLGAFINSSRLQFVEFFPKFMSASGKPLIPFRRSEEHVIVANKH